MSQAVIISGGKQHRVTIGEVLQLEKLQADAGETVNFDQVLMVSADGNHTIGNPTIDGGSVKAEVLEHGRGKKIRVFKFKRRKKYRRTIGHRQAYTKVKITEINTS